LSRKTRFRLIFFVLSVLLFIFVVAGVVVMRWLGEGEELQQQSANSYHSISHPATSQILFEGNCTGIGGGAGSSFCGIVYYCGLLGTKSSFEELKQYYKREFAKHSWQMVSEKVYKIGTQSQLELSEVGPNKPIFMNFDVPPSTLEAVWKSYTTEYLITVYSRSNDCPNLNP
jgi:hypothetical protein